MNKNIITRFLLILWTSVNYPNSGIFLGGHAKARIGLIHWNIKVVKNLTESKFSSNFRGALRDLCSFWPHAFCAKPVLHCSLYDECTHDADIYDEPDWLLTDKLSTIIDKNVKNEIKFCIMLTSTTPTSGSLLFLHIKTNNDLKTGKLFWIWSENHSIEHWWGCYILGQWTKHRKSAKLPWRHSLISSCLFVFLPFCLFVILSFCHVVFL